jgi:hypothetical protein
MYSVEYSTAPAVPTLRGRFGTESHDGSGTAGVFVSYEEMSRVYHEHAICLTSRKAVKRIGGTQITCTATLTWSNCYVS